MEKLQDFGDIRQRVFCAASVADRKLAFITSASLTSAALVRRMELGLLLLHGGTAPDGLRLHLTTW